MDFITIADEPYADEVLNFELAPQRRLALFLDSVLRWAKSILGSLTKELPFSEFLLELIEFIENAVHDTEDIR